MAFDIPWCEDSRFLLVATNDFYGERWVLDCYKSGRVAKAALRRLLRRKGKHAPATGDHSNFSIFKV